VKKVNILIVDDEQNIVNSLKGSLEDEGYEVLTAKNGEEALEIIKNKKVGIIFLDIWLPGRDGLETLKAIKEFDKEQYVVIMTGHGTISTSLKATKLGAYDFLEKPISLDNVLLLIHNIISHKNLKEKPKKSEYIKRKDEILIGDSLNFIKIKEEIEELSKIYNNLLINGENGTGKEFVAKLINNKWSSGSNSLVKINCNLYLPQELEKKLFESGKKESSEEGLIRAGNKITIYLNNIEELSSKLQKKLIKKIEQVKKKSENYNHPRIIAASTQNVLKMVKKAAFNKDLYAHLNQYNLYITPLRERKVDIPLLLEHFLEYFSLVFSLDKKEIDDDALDILVNYDWPGNVKELKNLCEILIKSVPVKRITINHIPDAIKGDDISSRIRIYEKANSFREAEKFWRKDFILYHLKKNDWDLIKTSNKLKIRKGTLDTFIKDLDIVRPTLKKLKILHQRTIKKSTLISGRGLHSGVKTGLILSPLPTDSGIIFGNISTGETIHANLDYVESTEFATSLKKNNSYAKTIEHFMAALHAYKISNLLIKINDELPIMDGSALDFCQLIEDAGLKDQEVYQEEIIIDKKYQWGDLKKDIKQIVIEPADEFSIRYYLDYPIPVGKQEFYFVLKDALDFKNNIAPSRTFGFLKDINTLEKKGLANGGRLNNFILIDDERVVNTKLRFSDEFVRHKILDIIGDFYLLGRPIKGAITAHMTGHMDNISLIKIIRDNLNLYW
jgi:two-component system nitrogen regulation response regulator NtrX